MAHNSLTLCVLAVLVLMVAAYLAGKRSGAGDVSAEATATASADAAARARSAAAGGRSSSAVNVVLVPPGADPAALAAALGTAAYEVEAPPAVAAEVVPPAAVEATAPAIPLFGEVER